MCFTNLIVPYQDSHFMLIIIDARAPETIHEYFSQLGTVIKFQTQGICYDAISGHPDVFMFQAGEKLIVAPNIPENYLTVLNDHGISYTMGKCPVGRKYPDTGRYNALKTRYGLLHNKNVTDPLVAKNSTGYIHCSQAYVRCTTIEVGEVLITSDKGIKAVLDDNMLDSLYVDPQNIVLQGFKNGFFGGCCGIWRKNIYFCGSLNSFIEAPKLRSIINKQGFDLIEVIGDYPLDVGGIFFLKTDQ